MIYEILLDYEKRLDIKNLVLILSAFFFVLPCLSQSVNPSSDLLIEKLQTLDRNTPVDMIYLQTSKSIYETGEDLWFKGYSLNAKHLTPSFLSKTLYVQLIKEETELVICQEKFEIQNGFSDGCLYLHDSLSEGNYLLEAYTGSSFFDDSTEFHASRRITIKKDMNPRPSFSAGFNKHYYEISDTISVILNALSENTEPLYAKIEATLFKGDKQLCQFEAVTNEQGKANLVFAPQAITEGLRVEAKVKFYNKEESHSFPVPCKKGNPVQFGVYPEGGNLLADMHSKVAFKAVDIDGNPLDVKGTLFEDNIPIVDFMSFHAGMGKMEFTPIFGKKYHIKLAEPKTDSTFSMPEIYQHGITMRLIRRNNEYLEFIVSQSPQQKKETVYLRGQLRGVVCCMATAQLNNEQIIKIPLKEFAQQGIAEFTLFNENLIQVAERLVYVNPDKNLHIETTLSKERYETREKAILKIKVTDEKGFPVAANLGVSVYDKLYQNRLDSKNILTHCLLSTQLKGKIYDPGFYFDNNKKDRAEALDLLLLTQGWRRYFWGEKNISEYAKPDSLQFSDGIEGLILTAKKNKTTNPMQQVIIASNFGDNKNSTLIFADSTGRFTITPEHLKIWEGGYVYLKPFATENIKSLIDLTDPFQTINEIMKTKEINYPLPKMDDTIKDESTRPFFVGPNVIELEEVVVKGRGDKTFRDKYMGHLDSMAKLDFCSDYVCWTCGGFSDDNPPNENSIPVLNCFYHDTDRTHRPIEGRMYAIRGGEKKGSDCFTSGEEIVYHYPKFTEEELLKMNNLSRVKAYHVRREFYQPNYDKETEADILPDFRNTLVWAPSVITNEKGEASLEFFCSDINTPFIGNVEGVCNLGLIGSKSFDFKVFRKKQINK